ncbi:MAG TPA: NAD(P)/FAD-dependent oxidoreductase [Armatimonadota bacterium]|nr:NAD(P)/FAD-dependent oxidoreductase [Armatimonadota bacterium]
MDANYDVVIIGGGPAGCTAALFTARAHLITLVLDKPGRSSTLEMLPAIHNYPGIVGDIDGVALVRTMRDQARADGAHILGEVVVATQLTVDPKHIYTSDGSAFHAQAVIVATGAYDRSTRILGEERYMGRGVSGCVSCDAPLYQGKVAIVLGEDDYAALEALELARYARQVYFVTSSPELRLSAEYATQLQNNAVVTIATGWIVQEILGDDVVREVLFSSSNGEKRVSTDGVFIYLYGNRPTVSFLVGEVPLGGDGGIIVQADRSTIIPKIYAAGSVVTGSIREIVVAAGDGCIAGLAAVRDVQGHAEIHSDCR